MLPLPAQRTKMDLSQPMVMGMVMACAFLVLAAAQPLCDPRTQYASDTGSGECCKRCEPGTYMSTMSTCQEPRCVPCRSSEYQEKYTKEDKCIKQPYCDKNLHFQAPVNVRTKKSVCQCKEGFHCSTTECTTCVPHKTCEPGFGVQSKGNHTHDTVCQKCPDGTFSDESSWSAACKEWTQCGYGQQQIQHGTEISDSICEGSSRTHVIVICVVVVGIIIIAISGFMYWNCKAKRGDAKGCLKGCVEWCAGGEHEPLATESKLVTTPTSDEESTMPEPLSSQEEGFARTPEENEDEPPSQEMSTDLLLTDKGRILTQENGKSEILSRQESQTQTFSA